MRLNRSLSHNRKVEGKATQNDVEATASYPEDPTQIINKGSCIKPEIFSIAETAFY